MLAELPVEFDRSWILVTRSRTLGDATTPLALGGFWGRRIQCTRIAESSQSVQRRARCTEDYQ